MQKAWILLITLFIFNLSYSKNLNSFLEEAIIESNLERVETILKEITLSPQQKDVSLCLSHDILQERLI